MVNDLRSKSTNWIAISIIVLVLFSGIIITYIYSFTFDTKTAPGKDQINTVGNTAANLMNNGLATTQGDKIYYINGNFAGEDHLMVMDWDGKNEQELCAVDGDLSELNIIGDQLFFVKSINDGDPYESGLFVNAAVCCLNLNDLSITEVYRSDDYLSELFVIENKMYFNTQSGEKVFAANLDGSDLTCVIEKNDAIFDFSIYENKMYYFVDYYESPLYCCDLDGSNESSFSFISGPTGYNIVNSKLYYVASELDRISSFIDTVNRPVVYSANLDGNIKFKILKSKGNHGLGDLNIVDNVMYYYDCKATYVSVDVMEYHNVIYAKKINGFSKKIDKIDNLINGLSVCGNWLFYYDRSKNETVKIEL